MKIFLMQIMLMKVLIRITIILMKLVTLIKMGNQALIKIKQLKMTTINQEE